jgi:hypothetical protein
MYMRDNYFIFISYSSTAISKVKYMPEVVIWQGYLRKWGGGNYFKTLLYNIVTDFLKASL